MDQVTRNKNHGLLHAYLRVMIFLFKEKVGNKNTFLLIY